MKIPQGEAHIRIHSVDLKIIRAMVKNKLLIEPCSGNRITSAKSVVRFLLEQWINQAPEDRLQFLYAGGYSLNVPGYALKWDLEDTPGERPAYIQIAKYAPQQERIEMKYYLNTKTGEMEFVPVVENDTDFFGGIIPEPEPEITFINEGKKYINLYENIKTGERIHFPVGDTPKDTTDLKMVKVIVNPTTGDTREVLIDSENSPIEYSSDELIADLIETDGGGIDLEWLGSEGSEEGDSEEDTTLPSPVDDEDEIGSYDDPISADGEPEPVADTPTSIAPTSSGQFISISGSRILIDDK